MENGQPHTEYEQQINADIQRSEERHRNKKASIISSVVDPDSYVFGFVCFRPPGSGSVSQMCGSGSFYHKAKIVRKTLTPTVL